MYTLQSMITGKYVGRMFAELHKDVFCAVLPADAYSWTDLDTAFTEQARIGQCLVVKIG